MLNSLRFSWDIDGVAYEVEVDLQEGYYPTLINVYAESGERIPTIDWEDHAFDDNEIDLIVATAYKMDRRASEVCRCGDTCRC
jgi:hypothetical protein